MENWHMSIRNHYDDYKNKWWGYLHKEGTLHVKPYFGPEDISEAWESPFVNKVFGPWKCGGRKEALELLKENIGGGMSLRY